MNYYEILGVTEQFTCKEIGQNYKKRCLECHPDRDPSKIREFQTLQEAYDILGDIEKRARYDRWLYSGIDVPFQVWLEREAIVHWETKAKVERIKDEASIATDANMSIRKKQFRTADHQNEETREKFRDYTL